MAISKTAEPSKLNARELLLLSSGEEMQMSTFIMETVKTTALSKYLGFMKPIGQVFNYVLIIKCTATCVDANLTFFSSFSGGAGSLESLGLMKLVFLVMIITLNAH